MYEPKLGRFLSRDPLPENGAELVHPVPDMTRYPYARNNPVNRVDPDGLQTAGDVGCTVELWCVKLFGGFKHCGIEICDATGCDKYHVMDKSGGLIPDKCIFGIKGRIAPWRPPGFGPPKWWLEKRWLEPDPNVCDCIRRTAAAITAADSTYSPVPTSDPCGGEPTCNSNYATKCLLRNCGLAYDWSWIRKPVGWDHRMSVCLQTKYVTVNAGRGECYYKCVCEQWKTTDDSWCGGP